MFHAMMAKTAGASRKEVLGAVAMAGTCPDWPLFWKACRQRWRGSRRNKPRGHGRVSGPERRVSHDQECDQPGLQDQEHRDQQELGLPGLVPVPAHSPERSVGTDQRRDEQPRLGSSIACAWPGACPSGTEGRSTIDRGKNDHRHQKVSAADHPSKKPILVNNKAFADFDSGTIIIR